MKGPTPVAEPNPHGCAGIAALLFAASPTAAMGLLVIAEFQQTRGRPAGGHVAIGVPPIWYIWLILLGFSLPWIIAGVLLLRRISAGRWIAFVLTLPTALLTVLTSIGVIVGLSERDSMTAKNVSAFGPIAFAGMLYCLTVWVTEYICRRKL